VTAAIVVGVVYFLVGWLFALPTTNAIAWRYAFWAVSAIVYLAQIGYEHFVRRSSPRLLAWHAGLASAIGGFGLAVAGLVHDLLTRGTVRPLFFVALAAWPLLTGTPALVGALLAGVALRRSRTKRRQSHAPESHLQAKESDS